MTTPRPFPARAILALWIVMLLPLGIGVSIGRAMGPATPCAPACPEDAFLVVAASSRYPSGFTTLHRVDGGWADTRGDGGRP